MPAPHVIGHWRRRLANPPGPMAPVQGATPSGVPVLQQQFSNLQLVVEVAWGADLGTTHSGIWKFYDVTSDVQIDGGKKITCSYGRRDERSVAGPATCQFTLDNRGNKYSASPFGLNWPNVKRGVPVRVRAVLGGNSTILFQGYASSWTPAFDTTGAYAVVAVVANGVLRKLGQGQQPLQSTMRMYTPTLSGLVAYWPMEDQSGANNFAPVTANTGPMAYNGTTVLHSNTVCLGSDGLPVFNGSAFAWTPGYSWNGAVQVSFLASWPAGVNALADQTPVLRVFTSGTTSWWDVIYRTNGNFQVQGHLAQDQSTVFDSGIITMNPTINATAGQVQLQLSQSGSDIAVGLAYYAQSTAAPQYYTATATGQTIVGVNELVVFPTAPQTQVAFGHLTVQGATSDIAVAQNAISAYDSEWADTRQGRLLVLAGAPTAGMLTDSSGVTSRMGPQRIDTPLNLIRECEATAEAILVDGLSATVTTWSHGALENRAADMTIDATTGAIVPPLQPADDDQLLRNQWTVQERNGSSVVWTDSSGPYGTLNAGLYADSETANPYLNTNGLQTGAFGDKAALDRASWRVHEGTVDGYRYPTLEIALHHTPALLTSLLALISGGGVGRLDITKLSTVYPQLPPGTLSLLIVGMSHSLDQFMWTTTLNCVPYDPWTVGVVSQPSGDTNPFLLRLDTSGSTVVNRVLVGATSITVQTTTGPIWTTRADDFPLTVSIGGLAVTVTNITGSSSPQTFTVDPTTVLKELPAGLPVSLWKATVLAIGATS